MLFDSHAHYDDEAYDLDREQLISNMHDANIKGIINIGASAASSKESLHLANKHSIIYAALGVHPSEAIDVDNGYIEWVKENSSNSKVVAIGEIGLDYYWPTPTQELQAEAFIRQIKLARELNLPVIIHSRDAAKDTLDILKEYADGLRILLHCYSYSPEIADVCIQRGYYFGIGGVITFKNARKSVEAVKLIPVENILLETDCPYLAPTPHRGERNSSLYLPLIADKIAKIKEISRQELENITWNNTIRFFNISQ